MEQWIKWEPIIGLEKKYDIADIIDGYKGFKIILKNSSKNSSDVEVDFFHSVPIYRKTNERFRLKTIHDLNKSKNTMYADWTFFKVLNSSYMDWLIQESFELFEPNRYTHFAFITDDLILDVIAGYEPHVKFLNYEDGF